MQENATAIIAVLGLLCLIAAALALYFGMGRTRLSHAVEEWRGRLEQTSNKLSALESASQSLAERKAELDEALADESAERARLSERLAALDATLAQERKAADEKIAVLKEGREQMTAEFKALAGQVIREHGEDFKKTAGEQLLGIVSPLKEDIGKFKGEMRTVREAAVKEQGALQEQLNTLTKRSEEMSTEAANLTKALRGDTKRQGAWGEAILERLLESSGLEQGREYRTQVFGRTEEGRALRPDVVVSLPGARELVIDSKVSLTAYDEAVNAEEDAVRDAALARHVLSIQSHIKTLSEKAYDSIVEGSLDYVIMFVPIEAALSEAVRAKEGLTEFALERQVMIATPTTLMMALRTIKTVWDVERRNRNAEDIASRAGLIYDKIVGFATDMERVGKQIDAARLAHADALTKLSSGRGNVLGQVEKLKLLGAKTNKTMPAALGVEADDSPSGSK